MTADCYKPLTAKNPCLPFVLSTYHEPLTAINPWLPMTLPAIVESVWLHGNLLPGLPGLPHWRRSVVTGPRPIKGPLDPCRGWGGGLRWTCQWVQYLKNDSGRPAAWKTGREMGGFVLHFFLHRNIVHHQDENLLISGNGQFELQYFTRKVFASTDALHTWIQENTVYHSFLRREHKEYILYLEKRILCSGGIDEGLCHESWESFRVYIWLSVLFFTHAKTTLHDIRE